MQQGKNVNAAAWRAASLRQLVNGFLDLYPGHAIHHICIAQFRQNSLSHLRSNACHKAIQAGKMVAELLLCMVGAPSYKLVYKPIHYNCILHKH